MKTSYFGIGDARAYRGCEADELLRYPSAVERVTTASHRDALCGLPVYTGRIDFADGTMAQFRFVNERERGAFAAEFVLRVRVAA